MGNSCPCRRCEKIPRKPVTLYMGGATPIESFAHHNYSIGSQPPPKTFLHYFVQPPTRGSGLGILQVPRFRLPALSGAVKHSVQWRLIMRQRTGLLLALLLLAVVGYTQERHQEHGGRG